jgi:hypothetical protein
VTLPNFSHTLDQVAGVLGLVKFERHLFVPELYLGKSKEGVLINHGTFRLRVSHDFEWGETTIAEENTTNDRATARALEGKELHLTGEQIRWLHQQLGELVVVLDAKKGCTCGSGGHLVGCVSAGCTCGPVREALSPRSHLSECPAKKVVDDGKA